MTSYRKTSRPFNSSLVWGIAIAFLFAIFLKNPQAASAYMKKGMTLCYASVVPSLFPFMVVSELLVSIGFGKATERWLGRPIGRMLGFSPAATGALILGWICGIPVGAKIAVSLFDRGEISQDELSRLLAVCNIPGSGFLVGVVGSTLYGDPRFGAYLYLCSLILSLGFALLLRGKHKKSGAETSLLLSAPSRFSASDFTRVLASATTSMLSVCACVVFFTSVVGCFSQICAAFSAPSWVKPLLFGLFEISSGVSASTSLENIHACAAVCGFTVGWSGISVHMQILSVVGARNVSLSPYFISKFFQGILCAALAWCYTRLFPASLSPTQSIDVIERIRYPLPTLLLLAFGIFSILMHLKVNRKD